MTSELSKVQIRLLYGILSVLSVGSIGWCSWVSMTLMSVPTRAEVKTIVRENAPYLQEKSAIEGAFQRALDSETEMKNAIADLAKETGAMRSQLSSQNTALAALNKRFDERFKVLPQDVLEELKKLREDVNQQRGQ